MQTKKKDEWCCPACLNKLVKKTKTGEGVKYCKKCGRSWFILNTSEVLR